MARELAELREKARCVLNSARTKRCSVTSRVVKRSPSGLTLSAITLAVGTKFFNSLSSPQKSFLGSFDAAFFLELITTLHDVCVFVSSLFQRAAAVRTVRKEGALHEISRIHAVHPHIPVIVYAHVPATVRTVSVGGHQSSSKQLVRPRSSC